MEELLDHFREWNKAWEMYKHYELKLPSIKPTSKEVFIEALEQKYKITKIKE